jgi:hypothetical protein
LPKVLTTVLILAGGGLLLASNEEYVRCNKIDKAQSTMDDSMFDLNLAVNKLSGHRYAPVHYRPSPKSDRTSVHVLAVLGVLCIGLGCVCLAVGSSARPPSGRGSGLRGRI